MVSVCKCKANLIDIKSKGSLFDLMCFKLTVRRYFNDGVFKVTFINVAISQTLKYVVRYNWIFFLIYKLYFEYMYYMAVAI